MVYRSFAAQPYSICRVTAANPATNIGKYSEPCVINSNEAKVVRLYYGILNRALSSSDIAYWAGQLNAKTKTPTDIARQFMGSSEFKNKYGSLTNQKFVEAMYPQVFGRAPDAAGLKFWVDSLNAKTTTREKMMVGFTESPEMKESFKAKVLAALKLNIVKDGEWYSFTPVNSRARYEKLEGGTCNIDALARDATYANGGSADLNFNEWGPYTDCPYTKLVKAGMTYIDLSDRFIERTFESTEVITTTEKLDRLYLHVNEANKVFKIKNGYVIIKFLPTGLCTKYTADSFKVDSDNPPVMKKIAVSCPTS